MDSVTRAFLDAWLAGESVPPVVAELGARLESWGDGEALVSMEAQARHHNPFGVVQGGILSALADIALGVAAATELAGDEMLATLEMRSVFHRPVAEGRLEARARALHRGRTSIYAECEISSEGRVLARVSATALIRPR